MKAHYYDPMFYISSEKMPFTIRIEATFKESVSGASLSHAVQKAITRYPYFCMKVVEEDGELLAVSNDRPIVVYPGPEVRPLGSPEVNGHLLAVSYEENRIALFVSHVITDGGGFFPFIKTVLYYYLCHRYQTELDPKGIRLVEEPFYDDETANPYPEEKMREAKPFYEVKRKPYFRLTDGGYVNDDVSTVYRFRLKEEEVFHFNYDNDGSPCALISSLMAKTIWSLHPDITEDIVSAVSFNLRPGLGNVHNYRLLCSAIRLNYPNSLREEGITKLCTCSRGMVFLQSQPENVLYYSEQQRQRLEKIGEITDLQKKKEIMGEMALRDATDNTFSVSYVGKMGLGSIEPYLDSMYNYTDGSTYRTVFLEISAVNGWFDIAFQQGFSSDVYYRAFLRQLEACGLHYVEEGKIPLNTPKMLLP